MRTDVVLPTLILLLLPLAWAGTKTVKKTKTKVDGGVEVMFFYTKTTCAELPSMCNNDIQKYKKIIAAGTGGRGFLIAAQLALDNVQDLCCKHYTRIWNTCGSHWWSIFEKTSKQLNSCDRQSLRQNNEEKLGVKPSLDHVSKIEDDNDESQSLVNHDASGKKSVDEIETMNGERRMANGEW